MSASLPTVLVVEDDAATRTMMRLACESSRLEVVDAATGADAVRLAKASEPDLILLDVSLPDRSGLDVCRRIRAGGITVPVIMVSGHDDLIDVVVGIEVGADDYVRKPYHVRELLARIAVQLRRCQQVTRPPADRFELADLVVDLRGRRVFRAGAEVDLTAFQFDMLGLLASRGGDTVSRSEIMRTLWGEDSLIDSRSIDAHMDRLRRRLGGDWGPDGYIETVPGVGYRMTVRPEAEIPALCAA